MFIKTEEVEDLLHQYDTDAAARDGVVLQIAAVRTQAQAVRTAVDNIRKELSRPATGAAVVHSPTAITAHKQPAA
jgi:hypothetical protein